MRTQAVVFGLVVVFAAACGGDDGDGSGSGGNSSSSGTGGTTSSGTGGSTSSGTGGSTSSGTGGSISSSGIGGGPICDADPTDDACITCTRASCCTELETCLLDEPCVCLLECFLSGTPPTSCLGQCSNSTAVSGLVACAAGTCGADCI